MTSKVPQKMPECLERPKAPAAPPTRDMRVSVEYKLVPTELTDEMIEASGCEGNFKMSPQEQAQEMWEAMLAAAPAVQGEPVAMVDADDDGMWADILPNVTVKVGQILYAAPQSGIPKTLTQEQQP